MVSVSDVLSQVRGRRGLGADEVEGDKRGDRDSGRRWKQRGEVDENKVKSREDWWWVLMKRLKTQLSMKDLPK